MTRDRHNTPVRFSGLPGLLFALMLGVPVTVWSADRAAPGVRTASPAALPAVQQAPTELRFTIQRFVVEGAKLFTPDDFNRVVAPYVGKSKDFSDVQHALEAVEELYATHGYSAVHVLLPEQELEAGMVRLQVIESRFGKVVVKDNHFSSKRNVLTALPSVRGGGIPRAKQISRELRLANESPVRQLNVVLKEGAADNLVDASVQVTDSKPQTVGVTLDNSGSKETGRSRLGLSYRYANLFDADHVAQLQMQLSPQHTDRVKVLGGSYKIPLYQYGHSVEFFGGYSNVNSLVDGLTNFKGGGLMLSSRYNVPLERQGAFDPRVTFGVDWRKFNKVEMGNPPPTVLFNEIVVTPLSADYSTHGKLGKGDAHFNGSLVMNVPAMGKGKSADFALYDKVNPLNQPKPGYKILRYGAGYMNAFANDWQLRTALSGQLSGDTLIQGEQIRLGGADGVRGFSEGSESGDSGAKLNLEIYSPELEKTDTRLRGLAFVDGGVVKAKGGKSTNISGAGFGLRAAYTEHSSLRLDVARIMKAGNDPQQLKGDWRIHASLAATF